MRSFTAAVVAFAAFASQVSATIYVTSPVATTVFTAGTNATMPINWSDDGNAPLLASIGACSIWLCTGGQNTQYCLQEVSASLDVSQNAQVTFVPTPSIGASQGAVWFIKFISLALKSTTSSAEPFTAFSAKFDLEGMTGTFNSTVEAAISAVATVPASTSAAGVSAASTPAVAVTSAAATANKVTTVTSKISSSTGTAKSTSTAKSGAFAVTAPSVVSSVTGVTVVMSFASIFFGMLAFGL